MKKPFKVQVLFRIPTTCANPCKAHAQLQLRNGTTILGNRVGLLLTSEGAKSVRFFVTIDKAKLLRAAGSVDFKGYRTTDTRLVVWTRGVDGAWSKTVKDGHISVAVGRIKGGGAPTAEGTIF